MSGFFSWFLYKTFDEFCVGPIVRGKMSSQCLGVYKIFVNSKVVEIETCFKEHEWYVGLKIMLPS